MGRPCFYIEVRVALAACSASLCSLYVQARRLSAVAESGAWGRCDNALALEPSYATVCQLLTKRPSPERSVSVACSDPAVAVAVAVAVACLSPGLSEEPRGTLVPCVTTGVSLCSLEVL